MRPLRSADPLRPSRLLRSDGSFAAFGAFACNSCDLDSFAASAAFAFCRVLCGHCGLCVLPGSLRPLRALRSTVVSRGSFVALRLGVLSRRGFSLLEVLIATTIVTVALAALAQLFALSINATRTAKTTTMATLLAMEKMEQLRSLMWGFDASGLPIADPRLATSPSDALRQNTSGFCDFAGASGQPLGETITPPAGAAYVRRWSIESLPADPANALVLQVLVTQRFSRRIEVGTNRHRLPDEARLVSVRARRAM